MVFELLTNTDKKYFLSREQFSEATTLSKGTVDNFIAAGTIRAVRVGRRVLIPLTELLRLEEQARLAKSEN